jgi:hypothetical protein
LFCCLIAIRVAEPIDDATQNLLGFFGSTMSGAERLRFGVELSLN